MSTIDCKFKVGETYKDREGDEWVLVARNDEYKNPLVFRHKNTGNTIQRHIDGRTGSDRNGPGDILPNRKREWLVTWEHARLGPVQQWSDTESAAKKLASALRDNDAGITTNVRGPFLWEESE